MREHRLRQLQERIAAGAAWQDLDLVFCSALGQPLVARSVTREFADLLRRAGIRKVRFHDLRHSYATFQLLAGVPMRVVMENLGHSAMAMTADLYSHVMPSMQRESADLMDAMFGSAGTR